MGRPEPGHKVQGWPNAESDPEESEQRPDHELHRSPVPVSTVRPPPRAASVREVPDPIRRALAKDRAVRTEAATTAWVIHQDGGMRDSLRLFPDYGAESPVWSRGRLVPFSQLRISDALGADLIAWRNEALDPSDERAECSEEEWESEARQLAARLAEETGRRVDLDV